MQNRQLTTGQGKTGWKDRRVQASAGHTGPRPADGDLLDRFSLGDLTAFDELVERYHLPVYQFAYRLTQDRADAEDLSQEVFLRAYRSLSGFHRASSLKTWLFQIALNLWRDGRRKPRESVEMPPSSVQDQGPLACLERLELQRRLRRAIATLPPKQRAACILRLCQDLPFKEIGEVMGSPVPTVKANFRLALLGLRRLLQDPSLDS